MIERAAGNRKEDIRQNNSELLISFYDEDGNKRKPLEILKLIQIELEKPVSVVEKVILDEKEISSEPEEGTEEIIKDLLWSIETLDGKTEIHPINSDCITINGEEEMWFFICRLLDCYQW